MRKVDAIREFLDANANPLLASLYTQGMEVQLNVSPEGGEKLQLEYDGRQYTAYTEGYFAYAKALDAGEVTAPTDEQRQAWLDRLSPKTRAISREPEAPEVRSMAD